jgi:hypothetical protein
MKTYTTYQPKQKPQGGKTPNGLGMSYHEEDDCK